MSSIVIAGDTSGTVTLQAPAVAGSTTVNLPSTPGNNGASAVVTTNASGNLGLGVTPSAWSLLGAGIQMKGHGSLVGRADGVVQTSYGLNNYFNGTNYIYLESTQATQYQQYQGQHIWKTAPSGTAGNAISFTQAMTLDASGNLGVGTTSPNYTLTFVNTASRNAGLQYTNADPNTFLDIISGGISGGWLGGIRFFTSASAAVSERMRIDSAGRVGLNTTSQGSNPDQMYILTDSTSKYGLHINYENASSGAATVGAIRIDGIQGRGQGTNTGISIDIREQDSGQCYGIFAKTTSVYSSDAVIYQDLAKDLGAYTSGTCNYARITTSGSGGTAYFYFGYDQTGGATRFYVLQNGGIGNYQANNVNLSDRREKTDFAPAKNYLDTICAIPVQTFKYIDQTDDAPTLGVVAQDVQAVAPELVCESDWASEGEEKKMRLSIYQTDLQYALMKCIQELNAKVEALTAELNTLKGQA